MNFFTLLAQHYYKASSAAPECVFVTFLKPRVCVQFNLFFFLLRLLLLGPRSVEKRFFLLFPR